MSGLVHRELLKALWFCHEFFIPFRTPALNFDRGLLLYVTSKPRTANDKSAEAVLFICVLTGGLYNSACENKCFIYLFREPHLNGQQKVQDIHVSAAITNISIHSTATPYLLRLSRCEAA